MLEAQVLDKLVVVHGMLEQHRLVLCSKSLVPRRQALVLCMLVQAHGKMEEVHCKLVQVLYRLVGVHGMLGQHRLVLAPCT